MPTLTASPARRARTEVIPSTPTAFVGVQYDCPVSQERVAGWQRELDLIAPKNDVISWLHISWVPGDFWERSVLADGRTLTAGIGRFFIWQMIPKRRIPEMVLADLEGPNPRSFGHWNARDGVFEQRRSCAVNRVQWELYRETGAWARPYWIVQGTKGGHLRRYTDVQAKVMGMQGLPQSPDAPGDLPYAEPDRRTFAALARLDLVRSYDKMIDFAERKPEDLEKTEMEAVEAMRHQLWKWLSDQTEARLSEQKSFLRAVSDSLPVGVTSRQTFNPEALHERFVTSD